MARSQPPQVLLLGADTRLGSAIRAVSEGLIAANKIGSIIPKNKQTLDLTDLQQVQKQFKALVPDVVINCNDYLPISSLPFTDNDRDKVWNNVTLGADNVSKVCALYGLPLIHLSSCDVFGRPRINRSLSSLSETDCVDPTTDVGYAQVGAEHAVLRLGQNQADLAKRGYKYFVIRTGPIFGFVKGLDPAQSAINTLVGWAGTYLSSKANSVMLADDVIASPVCSFDLAKFILWLCTEVKKAPCGIYHFANEGFPAAADYGALLYREIRGFKNVVAAKRSDIALADPKRKIKASTPLNCSKVAEAFNYPVRNWAESASIYAKMCNQQQ